MSETESADVTTPREQDAAPLPARLWLDWLVVFLAGLILYIATCAPDVLMGDSGVYQLRVSAFPPFPPLTDTLVQVHPLYLMLAKPFTWLPLGTLAYRVNLCSTVFGGITLASVFVTVRLLTQSRWAAAIGTLSVGLGHTFWWFSVVAECLTLASAFMVTELLCLVIFARTSRPRWFLLAALLNGLSISNHMMGALATPVYAVLTVVWLRRDRVSWSDVFGAVGLWLLGTCPYLFVILRTLMQTGDLPRILRSATTGNWPALNVTITASMVGKVAAYIGLQYPTLLGLLAILAIWARPADERYRPIKWAVFGVAAFQFIFAARYPRPDQYSFFVPCYACVGVLIGLGAWAVIRRWRWACWAGLALAVVPIGIYARLPDIARRLEFNPFTRAMPYRDPYELFLKPWQQSNDGVRRYLDEVFEILPPDAVLFADITPAGALVYGQLVEGRRRDILLIWSWQEEMSLDQMLYHTFPPRWKRPIYTVSDNDRYGPPFLIRQCRLVPEGIVYRVEAPRDYRFSH